MSNTGRVVYGRETLDERGRVLLKYGREWRRKCILPESVYVAVALNSGQIKVALIRMNIHQIVHYYAQSPASFRAAILQLSMWARDFEDMTYGELFCNARENF